MSDRDFGEQILTTVGALKNSPSLMTTMAPRGVTKPKQSDSFLLAQPSLVHMAWLLSSLPLPPCLGRRQLAGPLALALAWPPEHWFSPWVPKSYPLFLFKCMFPVWTLRGSDFLGPQNLHLSQEPQGLVAP